MLENRKRIDIITILVLDGILLEGKSFPKLLQNPGLDNLIKGFIGLPFGLALIVICGELYGLCWTCKLLRCFAQEEA